MDDPDKRGPTHRHARVRSRPDEQDHPLNPMAIGGSRLNGKLSTADRDQFFREQKVPGALLGVRHEHLPSSFAEAEEFMAKARRTFAVGEQGRTILEVFDSGKHTPGSVISNLPFYYRIPASVAICALTDVALTTMHPADRHLTGINRKPILRFKFMVTLSKRAFGAFFASVRGQRIFDKFLKANVAGIRERANQAEAALGGHAAAAKLFVVPDPAPFVYDLADRVENMPAAMVP